MFFSKLNACVAVGICASIFVKVLVSVPGARVVTIIWCM